MGNDPTEIPILDEHYDVTPDEALMEVIDLDKCRSGEFNDLI
jgi:hypothetical protein